MRRTKAFICFSLLTALVLAGAHYLDRHPPLILSRSNIASSASSSVQVAAVSNLLLDPQSKTLDCVAQGSLPDHACTPGAVFASTTKEEICTPGYAGKARNVSTALKNKVYAAYGITTRTAGEYQIDHLVSLELGGSNDIANLWPEASGSVPGYHEKDDVEDYLHKELCSGAMSLAEVQYLIATDWTKVWFNKETGF